MANLPIDENNIDSFVVCRECNKKLRHITWRHLKYKHSMTIDEYLTKWKLCNNDIICRQVLEVRPNTIDNFIKKYGDIEGRKRFDSYRSLQAIKNTFEHKKEKYGWTKEQFDEFNKSRAVTYDNLIKRHGKENGEIVWNNYIDIQRYAGCKLEYFIEKYGQENGEKKYKEVNLKKRLTIDNFIRKYGETDGKLYYDKYLSNCNNIASASSNKFFDELITYIPKSFHQFIFYDKNNGEYFFSKKGYNVIFSDFYDCSKNKIIEFYGDYWHSNPKIYDENFIFPHNKLKACDVWERDAKRIKILKEVFSKEVLIIWENDAIKDRLNTINLCLQFLNYDKIS